MSIVKFSFSTIMEFQDAFSDNRKALQHLADIKWANGFMCPKCGNKTHCRVYYTLSRKCQSCNHIDSPTAGTLFHKVKFPLWKAFWIIYQMSMAKKGKSSYELGRELGIRQKTAWLFRRKVQEAMASLGRHPLEGEVEVDEFMIGQKEPGKKGRSKGSKRLVIMSIERRGEKGIGRGYATTVENATSEQLEEFIEEKVDKEAEITTDEWKGYTPLKAKWKITQKKSDNGKGMPQIHNIIMNLKGWLRGIHHKCSKAHLQSYLDEFFYRFNRRNSRNTIFDGLIIRMMEHQPFSIQAFREDRILCA